MSGNIGKSILVIELKGDVMSWSLQIYNIQATTPSWEVDTYDNGFAVSFPRSTKKLPAGLKSNSQFVKLVDGSEAVIQPITAYLKADISFSASPLIVTDDMITKFNGYISNNIGLKITTHTGEVFEGYIKDIRKNYEMVGSPQLYSIDIAFKQFDVDSDGSY